MIELLQLTLPRFLRPLQPLLDDTGVGEILLNGYDELFIERDGLLARGTTPFAHPDELDALIRHISQCLGRPFDEARPFLDGHLPDGSRIHVVHKCIHRRGHGVAIRKFTRQTMDLSGLVQRGTLTESQAFILGDEIRAGANILVSGGTGTGKTTLLNVFSRSIPSRERVVLIEDAAELHLNTEHVVRLETRPATPDGFGEVGMRELVKSALRLRPDRLVVGEVRGAEAFDLIQAMSTGHRGCMATLHAGSPSQALRRLEVLASMAGLPIHPGTLRAQIEEAIQLIVQIERQSDGSRIVTHIMRRGDFRAKAEG